MKNFLLSFLFLAALPLVFATNMQIYPSSVTMKPNTSLRFTVIVTDSDGTAYTPQNVKWQTYPGSIGYDGTYSSPNQAGYYNVTAQWNGQKATASVTVKQAHPNVSRIVIDPYNGTVAINKYLQFKAIAYDSYGRVVEFSPKWWGDGGTISNNGYYQAGYNAGRYTVWVQDTHSGVKASASVTIIREIEPNPNPSHGVSKIAITPRNKQVGINSYVQFEAYAYDRYDRKVNFTPVWWTDGGGTISNKGYYTAGYKPGYYTIWVKDSYTGIKASTTVEVIRQVVNDPPPTSDARIDVLHWDIDQDSVFHRPHAKVKFKAYGYNVHKASLHGVYRNKKSTEIESRSCSNESEIYFREKFDHNVYWLEIRLYDSYNNVIAKYRARAK